MRSARYRGSPWASESNQGEAGVVWRPGRSGVSPAQERSRRPAGERQEHLLSSWIPLGVEPDLRPVAIESKTSQEICRRDHRGAIEGEILKPPGADLTHPDVELSSLVGDERDEPAIGRNVGLLFRALPVGDPRERGVGERVPGDLDGYAAPGFPRDHSRGERHQRHPWQPFQPGVRRSGAALPARLESPGALRRSRRSRSGRHRYLSGAASDPSPGSGAGAVESAQVSRPAAPTSPARARGSSRSSPRSCRRQTPRARSASRRGRSRTPRCRCACRPAVRAPVRDSCRRRCR